MAPQDDDESGTAFYVIFDDETMAMLVELSEACHAAPAHLVAAIVRDVLRDDQEAHGSVWTDPAITVPTIN